MHWDPKRFFVLKKGVDVRLSEHFWSHEFDCKCSYPECTDTIVSKELVVFLEDARWGLSKLEKTEVPIVINCGNRCERHNADPKVGGAPDSRHLLKHGDGADLRGIISPKQIKFLEQLVGSRGGFHSYAWGCHCDVRGFKSRW